MHQRQSLHYAMRWERTPSRFLSRQVRCFRRNLCLGILPLSALRLKSLTPLSNLQTQYDRIPFARTSRINLKQLDSSQASSWRPRALPHKRKPATFRITTSSPSHSPSLSPADWSGNGPPLHLLHRTPVVPKAADRGAVAGGDDTPVSNHPRVPDVPKQSADAFPSSISGDLQTNHQLALSQSTLLPDESANLSPSAPGDGGDHPLRSPTPKSSMLPPADDAFPSRSPSPLRVDVASPVSPSFPPIAHSPSASPVTPKQTAPLPTASQKPAEATISAPSPWEISQALARPILPVLAAQICVLPRYLAGPKFLPPPGGNLHPSKANRRERHKHPEPASPQLVRMFPQSPFSHPHLQPQSLPLYPR
ncbi:hypothetical protein BD779DRAFT_520064 [Infundibulicybe gibba]|nr:hypothetical protein BD779DRAFT_520064 [Infundibulicybe gibba]